MKNITLAIIAGGAGTRMGVPKHRLRIRGRAILEDLLDRMEWEGPTMLVVARAGQIVEGMSRIDRVVADEIADEGPLRGILTALERAVTSAIVAIPIDMIRLRGEHARWIARCASESEAPCLMLRSGTGEIEPFPGHFTSDVAAIVRRRLSEEKRSLVGLAEEDGTRIVDAPRDWPTEVWTNVNTPEEAHRLGVQIAVPC